VGAIEITTVAPTHPKDDLMELEPIPVARPEVITNESYSHDRFKEEIIDVELEDVALAAKCLLHHGHSIADNERKDLLLYLRLIGNHLKEMRKKPRKTPNQRRLLQRPSIL